MSKFIIKANGTEKLVAGFNSQHQIVQLAGTADFAKLFPTQKSAEKFLEKYCGAGYGLTVGLIQPV